MSGSLRQGFDARRRSARGFTLIELVVVVAILVVLAGILVPMVSNEVDGARNARATMDMRTAANAFLSYRAATGRWPSNVSGTVTADSDEELTDYACLYTNTYSYPGWNGPYMNDGHLVSGAWKVAGSDVKEGLHDPWGKPFVIYWFKGGSTMGEGGGIALLCRGPNGAVDTSNANVAVGDAQGDDVLYIVTRKL